MANAAIQESNERPKMPQSEEAPSTKDQTSDHRVTVVQRLFILQLAILAVGTIYMVIGSNRYGFFWPSFLVGCLGGSLALLRRLSREDVGYLAKSHFVTAMPILYGGLMAAIAYGLFLSEILSGEGGNGLLSTNLFPNFIDPGGWQNWLRREQGATIAKFLRLRPATIQDMGKLLVWCFLAGYSESFVTGVLGQLERHSTSIDDAN